MAAAAGVPLSDLLRQAMARPRTWSAADAERERTRQVARIGSNLNQLARWANRHTSAVEAVEVIANLVAFERELHKLARSGGDGGGAGRLDVGAARRFSRGRCAASNCLKGAGASERRDRGGRSVRRASAAATPASQASLANGPPGFPGRFEFGTQA